MSEDLTDSEGQLAVMERESDEAARLLILALFVFGVLLYGVCFVGKVILGAA